MTDNNEQNLGDASSEGRLLPFQLETSVLRGRLVRLDGAMDVILRQHAYPAPVANLLAEATALAAALGSALKFDGIFTIQAKGDGPITLLVADVTSDGALRAYAQFDEAKLAVHPAGASLLGQGNLVFTVDQKLGEERYQGIVALEGDSLTEAFQAYFRQSEQIPTGLLVAARQDAGGAWHAGCLMVQQMPREGGTDVCTDTSAEDDWRRTMMLMQTCTPLELTDPTLAGEDLLFRLFHQEGVRAFEPKTFRHECRCSRERLASLLAGMDKAELKELAIEGKIDVTCQFCSKVYRFAEDEFLG